MGVYDIEKFSKRWLKRYLEAEENFVKGKKAYERNFKEFHGLMEGYKRSIKYDKMSNEDRVRANLETLNQMKSERYHYCINRERAIIMETRQAKSKMMYAICRLRQLANEAKKQGKADLYARLHTHLHLNNNFYIDDRKQRQQPKVLKKETL